MSRRVGFSDQRQVNFIEDKRVDKDYHAYISKVSRMPSERLEGPHFPNLQAIFNRRNAYEESGSEIRVEEEEKIFYPSRQANEDYHSYISRISRMPSERFEGPYFPNLQLLNSKNTQEHYEETKERVQSVGFEPKKHGKEHKQQILEDDIDLEAVDFIVRKHRYLEK